MTIGVFDSGRGAYFVADRLQPLFPADDFRIITDDEHVPYGNRTPEEILALVDYAIQPLIDECEIIILACNTATAVGIDWLRAEYPTHKFIGFEPMIKPAAELSDTHTVTILATQATRRSERYQQLIEHYGKNLTVLEPNTDNWARKIEDDSADEIDLREVVATISEQRSDVIALACTHYLALEERLRQDIPNTTIIEPTPAIARQLSRLLETSLLQ